MTSLPLVVSPRSCASIASICSQRDLDISSMPKIWTGMGPIRESSFVFGEVIPRGKQGVFGIKMLSAAKLLARRRCLTVARSAGRGVAARWVWRRLVSH